MVIRFLCLDCTVNLVLLVLNCCSVFVSIFGNFTAISNFSRHESVFNNLISALALLDAATAVAGNAIVFYHVVQNIYEAPDVNEAMVHLLNFTGITNVIILLAITAACWFSLKGAWVPNYGPSHAKLTLFTCVTFIQQLYTFINWQYHLELDQLVCIISMSFCVLNVLIYQILSTLNEAINANGETSPTMVRHQYMVNQMIIKLIQFSVAWIPFLVLSKISSISELHGFIYGKGGYLLWSVTWVFSKATLEPISERVLA